jgi:hypothetical protein
MQSICAVIAKGLIAGTPRALGQFVRRRPYGQPIKSDQRTHSGGRGGEGRTPDWVYVGQVCNLCWGSDADDCPACDGTGEIGSLIPLAAFRVLAGVDGPVVPSLLTY